MATFQSSSSSTTRNLNLPLGVVTFLFLVGIASAQLSPTFYATSCPSALSIIKSGVTSAVAKEARMGASLLRLHFHDCFVNGCDASILLDGASGEQSAPANANSIRGLEVIDSIKSNLEASCPGVVSCADIVAVAARDSVVALSGPSWTVQLGRRDSAAPGTVGSNLPAPTDDLTTLISSFSSKGFTAKELVALSGSHSIGKAQCFTFRTRIYNETNIDSAFATSLQANCPFSSGNTNLANLDVTTPNVFDNAYFKNLVNKKGLLHSDQQLFNGGSTDAQVTAYSNNPVSFRTDFASAMVKMGNLSPLTGTNGQIRTNCGKAN